MDGIGAEPDSGKDEEQRINVNNGYNYRFDYNEGYQLWLGDRLIRNAELHTENVLCARLTALEQENERRRENPCKLCKGTGIGFGTIETPEHYDERTPTSEDTEGDPRTRSADFSDYSGLRRNHER